MRVAVLTTAIDRLARWCHQLAGDTDFGAISAVVQEIASEVEALESRRYPFKKRSFATAQIYHMASLMDAWAPQQSRLSVTFREHTGCLQMV